MNSAMLSFLQSIGAELNGDDNSSFTDAPIAFDTLIAQNTLTPLSHYDVLAVRGPEAEKFLQGQITCSASDVTSTLSSPGAFCTPKGRVIASFQLLRPQVDVFWLRLRADLLDIAARSLGKYIVFSKAKLGVGEPTVGIGLHGPEVGSLLHELIGTLPTQLNGSVSYGDGLLLQCDEAATRFEYWGPAATAARLWAHCQPHCVATGSNYWRWLQIRAGNAEIGAATSEIFLPHMLNYHETGAINFKKGCYTGQEIVARTHYRGQVKRHLLRAALTSTTPAAGSDISAAEKIVGHVVDAVAIGDGSAELLAVVANDSVEAATILHAGAAELRLLG